LFLKKILIEDRELRNEFESLWERFLIGFYNFNKKEFNILIEDFVNFYEFLAKLPELPKIRALEDLIKYE